MSQQFDSLIIGEVAQDTNVDYDGTTVRAVGGAVYYSGCLLYTSDAADD